jgi:hypothetical protein
MADARVEAAITHWAGRFIANGIDYNDFARTTSGIERWDQWLDAWTATAEVHVELAEQALRRNRHRSAGEAYLQAAISYHFSKFVWVLDPERNRRNTEAAVRAARSARRTDRGAVGGRPRGRQPASPRRRAPRAAGRADPGP